MEEENKEPELLDAKAELEKLDDGQLLNVFVNSLERCKKDNSVIAKNIFMLSMELCIEKQLLGEMNQDDKDELLKIADQVV